MPSLQKSGACCAKSAEARVERQQSDALTLHVRDQRILFHPQCIDPRLKPRAELRVVLVVAVDQVRRYRQFTDAYANLAHAIGKQIDKRRRAARVSDGDVDDGLQYVAHRLQHESRAASARSKKIPEG